MVSDKVCQTSASLKLNKANGNPVTGDALNAEKVLGTDRIMTLDTTGYIDIPEGADLNNEKYRQFGAYACPFTTRAPTLINCPTKVAFRMCVVPGTGTGTAYPMQIIAPMDVGLEFRRVWMNDSKSWGEWRETAQIESGTWTPQLFGTEIAGVPSYQKQIGYFVRIGSVYIVNANVKLSNKGGMKGNIKFRGFPSAGKNYTSGTVAGTSGMAVNGEITSHINLEITNYGDAWLMRYPPNRGSFKYVTDTDITDTFAMEDLSSVFIVNNL